MASDLTAASRAARTGHSTTRRGSALASVAQAATPPPPAAPLPPPQAIVTEVAPVVPLPVPTLPPPEPAQLPAIKEEESQTINVEEIRGAGLAIIADVAALLTMEEAESQAHPATAAANAAEVEMLKRIETNAVSILSGAIGGQLWVPHGGEPKAAFIDRASKGSHGKFSFDAWHASDEKIVREKAPNNFKGEGW